MFDPRRRRGSSSSPSHFPSSIQIGTRLSTVTYINRSVLFVLFSTSSPASSDDVSLSSSSFFLLLLSQITNQRNMRAEDHEALVAGLQAMEGINLTIALLEEVSSLSFFLHSSLRRVKLRTESRLGSFPLPPAFSRRADLSRPQHRYHARLTRGWIHSHGLDETRECVDRG